VLGQRERAHVGAGVQRGGQWQGICVEMTPKEFIRTPLARVRWTEGWRGTGPRGAHGRAGAAHGAYAAKRARWQGYGEVQMVHFRPRQLGQQGRRRDASSSSSWRGIPAGAATGGSRTAAMGRHGAS
jgi:hypothetical protein